MTAPSPSTVRNRRIINFLVWTAIWAGVVQFTEAWGDWVSMFFEAIIPTMLGGYVHLILRGQDSPPDHLLH